MASTPSAVPFFARLAPARISTGTKMLLILTAALLPLGLIAVIASIHSARSKQEQRAADARVVATAEARQVDILLLRISGLLRANLAVATPGPRSCRTMLERDQSALDGDIAFALFDEAGQPICTTPGFPATLLQNPAASAPVLLLPGDGGVRFAVRGALGGYGIAQIPPALLSHILATASDGSQGIAITQASQRLVVLPAPRVGTLARQIVVSAPAGSGRLRIELVANSSPFSLVEVLLVLLPILTWAAAAIICWLVLDQALVRPLRLMQRAITAYQPGDGPLVLPRISTPAEEIRSLGASLETTTAQVIARELELEEGLSHQVRLTREVHHRVKNNLQVVASLINLHARGTEGDVAAAYASIQRRVDALAVVHRNHYAELEENRGVALRSIVSELTSNLRATAPPSAQHLMITLNIAPAFVSQDVAVPVAFLVTEIVELVMACNPAETIAISLTPTSSPDRAIFAIQAQSLGSGACENHLSRPRFDRIITGLSRQLRSNLDYDPAIGRYQIEIAATQDGPDEKS